MACFHPLQAWQLDGGEIVFAERGKVRRALLLPCGRCIGCRLVKVRSWAIRCVHEAQMHEVSSFVTLTYEGDGPSHTDCDCEFKNALSLCYVDYQRFMYRLRRSKGPTRFFVCGEYGELSGRPHFHALLFGRTFGGGIPCGKDICQSAELNRLWPHGFSSFGSVTYESAAYVARYATKKITGSRASSHYTRVDLRSGEFVSVVPEFGHMSLKPGIGYSWFQKYWREVYVPRDGVVRPGGFVCPPPRYYDNLLRGVDGFLADEKDYDRYVRSARFAEDCTVERLAVREKCAIAKAKFLRRTL